ncbi:uncharacterized protein LOC134078036 [Sardina pilchardus]|uniref:uncharacterized protein LOC134078036 n=1 Tax=Sardina pilchardus TaxID=27697 RepID=UPI002E0D8452
MKERLVGHLMEFIIMDTSEGSNLASQVLLEKLEGEANSNQEQSCQMETNLLLRLEVKDLKKRLEEKENRLNQAQDTIKAMRNEINSLQECLDIEKRKYQSLMEQHSQRSPFVQPDSEAKTTACVDRPTLLLSCVSEPTLTGPSSPPSPLASTSEPSPTYPSCSGDVVERDWHTTSTATTTTTKSDVDLCRASKPNPTTLSDSVRSTQRSPQPSPLRMLSVTLEDCRHKLQSDGVFNVQSLGHDDDDDDDDYDDDGGGGDDDDEDYADHTTESERYQFGSEDLKKKRLLPCSQCTKKFSQLNHLKLHQRMHNRKLLLNSPCASEGEDQGQERLNVDGAFCCDQCSRTFSQFSDLQRHQRTHENIKNSQIQGHKCDTCEKIFLHSSSLRIHERVHTGERPYTCTVCGKGFTQLGNLKKHHRKHEKESSLSHTTGMQTQDTLSMPPGDQSKSGKVSQFRKTHTRPYACSACGKAFSQSRSLRAHIRTHEENKSVVDGAIERQAVTLVARPKPHKCADCGKAFSLRAQLQVHRRIHTGEKPYACDVCEKAFSQLAGLQRHQLLHHDKAGKQRVFECDVCEKKLRSSSALLIHKVKHQPLNVRERPYSCTRCEKKFSLLEYLRSHERYHSMEKRYQCSHCQKAFITPSKLRQHMPKHTGEKPYSCSKCSKAFKSPSGLKEHIKLHTGEMPYSCLICNKVFKSLSNRQEHMRTHSRERPYLCHICGRAFRRGSCLSKHQKTHTGDKPHACTHCGQKFLKLTNLRRHQLRHTGQRPHMCASCGKTFSRLETLKTHERVHTGERPYRCIVCDERFAYVQSLQSHQKREHQIQDTHSVNGRRPQQQQQQRARCVESSEALQDIETHRPGIQNGGALDGIVDSPVSEEQYRLTPTVTLATRDSDNSTNLPLSGEVLCGYFKWYITEPRHFESDLSDQGNDMEGNVSCKRKGKERRSIVWSHFTLLGEDTSRPTVVCVHCKKTLYQCQGSTTSMLKHLKAQHATEINHTDGLKSESEQQLDHRAEETGPNMERRGKRSIVWLHFTRLGKDTLACLHCKKRLRYHNSTTYMHRHLQVHHPHVNSKGRQETTSRTSRTPKKLSQRTKQQPLVFKGASVSPQERDVESSEGVDVHSKDGRLLQLQVDALLKQLEGKERQLTQAYQTFQNTVRALGEDMKSIQEQLAHLTEGHHGAEKERPSTVRHTQSIEYEACEDRHLFALSCTSEPNSPGFDDTAQRSSQDQEVTIIGLLTPPSTAVANSNSILEFVNTFMQTAYTAEANTTTTTAADSVSDPERQPAPLPLKTLLVRLQDCRHKLGPDGTFTVHSGEMPGRQEEKDFDDDDDDDGEDGDDDGGEYGGDDVVSDYNYESDPDYVPEDDANSDQNPEKFLLKSCRKKMSQQGSSLHAMQHPESPPQKASLEVHEGSSSEERPFKCPLCEESYRYCPDYIQHLKTHSSPTFTLHGQQEREDDDDDDDDDNDDDDDDGDDDDNDDDDDDDINTEKDPEDSLENGGNSYDSPDMRSEERCQLPPNGASSAQHEEDDLGHHMEAEEEELCHGDGVNDEIDGDGNEVNNGEDTNYNLEDDCNSNDNPEDEAFQSSSKDGNNISSADNMENNEIGDVTVNRCLSQPKRVKPYQCQTCGRRLSTSGALHIHQRQHSGEKVHCERDARGRKVYKCAKCDKSFVGVTLFHVHQSTHLGERPYVCPRCKKTFVYPTGLRVHQNFHCKEWPQQQVEAAGDGGPQTPSARARRRRTYAHACAQCPMTFYQKCSLRVHERSHSDERPLECPLCGKRLKHAGTLREHLKTHDGRKRHLCDSCGKSFPRWGSLRRHLALHTGEKPYKCSVCDKRYHLQQSLNTHMLNHSEDRPFRCGVCDKGFTRLHLVQKHERVHTKEKPYRCSICLKNFGYQESLYMHQKRFHSALGH